MEFHDTDGNGAHPNGFDGKTGGRGDEAASQFFWNRAIDAIFEKSTVGARAALIINRMTSYFLGVAPPRLPCCKTKMQKAALLDEETGDAEVVQLVEDTYFKCDVRSKTKGIVEAGCDRIASENAWLEEDLARETATLAETPARTTQLQAGQSVSFWFTSWKVARVISLSLLFIVFLVGDFSNVQTIMLGSGTPFESNFALACFTLPLVIMPFALLLFVDTVIGRRVRKYFLYAIAIVGLLLMVTLIVMFTQKFAREKTSSKLQRTQRSAHVKEAMPDLDRSASAIGRKTAIGPQTLPGPSFATFSTVLMLFQITVVMALPIAIRHYATQLPASVSESVETEEYKKLKTSIRVLQGFLAENRTTLRQLTQIGVKLDAEKGAYLFELREELKTNRELLKLMGEKAYLAKFKMVS